MALPVDGATVTPHNGLPYPTAFADSQFKSDKPELAPQSQNTESHSSRKYESNIVKNVSLFNFIN